MEGRVFITVSYVCVHELCRENLADRTICLKRRAETTRKHHGFCGKISRMLMNPSAVSSAQSMLSVCCRGLWIVRYWEWQIQVYLLRLPFWTVGQTKKRRNYFCVYFYTIFIFICFWVLKFSELMNWSDQTYARDEMWLRERRKRKVQIL